GVYQSTRRASKAFVRLLLFHEPEIAELHEIAVALEAQHPRRALVFAARAARRAGHLDVVVDEHAVEPGCQSRTRYLLARAVRRGVCEVDVERLPLQRR